MQRRTYSGSDCICYWDDCQGPFERSNTVATNSASITTQSSCRELTRGRSTASSNAVLGEGYFQYQNLSWDSGPTKTTPPKRCAPAIKQSIVPKK